MGRQSDTAVEEELIYTIRAEDFVVNFCIHPMMGRIIDLKNDAAETLLYPDLNLPELNKIIQYVTYRMEIRTKMAAFLFTVIFMAAVLFFCLYYPFSFNYETAIKDQYYLVFNLPVLVVIYLLSIPWKERLTIQQIMALATVIIICFLVVLSNCYSFGNEHFFVACSVYLLCSSVLLLKKTPPLHAILFFLVLVFLYELVTGYLQLLEVWGVDENVSLYLKGSLQNSGVYGCYLVTQLPIVFYIFFQWKPLNNKVFNYLPASVRKSAFSIVFAASLFMVYKTQSRTAYIALFVTMITWALFNSGAFIKQRMFAVNKAWMVAFFFVALGFCSFAGYFLFGMKKMSAIGRLMKLRVTMDHIADHFWMGTGLGRFTWYYPQWQAQYFIDHSKVPKDYFLSAGESYIIFNEYVQLFKEVGFIGCIVFILLLLHFFTSRSTTHKYLLFTAKLTVIAILACGFTSYPFHLNVFLLLLAFCFAVVFSLRENSSQLGRTVPIKNRLLNGALAGGVVMLLGFTGYKGIDAYSVVRRWEIIRNDNLLRPVEAKGQCAPLYYVLRTDGKFLTEYGEWLAQDSANGSKAIAVLEEAKLFFLTRQTMETTARAYVAMGNYPAAIDNMKWLGHFLPNKFTPKYELLKLYQQQKDTANVKKTALEILDMHVKIPSAEVDRIKSEASLLINNYGR